MTACGMTGGERALCALGCCLLAYGAAVLAWRVLVWAVQTGRVDLEKLNRKLRGY